MGHLVMKLIIWIVCGATSGKCILLEVARVGVVLRESVYTSTIFLLHCGVRVAVISEGLV